MNPVLLVVFALVVGFVLGIVAAIFMYRVKRAGTLRIDRSDPTEPPYIFLELDKGVGDISRKKNVILKVKNENYISQK